MQALECLSKARDQLEVHGEPPKEFFEADQAFSEDEKTALERQFQKEDEKMSGRDFFDTSEKLVFEMCFLLGEQ